MSVAEALAPARPQRLVSTRMYRSELTLIFGRRRNWAGLAVLAAVPIIIGLTVYFSTPEGNDGPPFLRDIASNGLFLALTSLTAELLLFLPLAVSAIAGDSIAGEANQGTLRYLLTVPVHRARLLVVKFAGIVTFCFAATLLIATTGSIVGLILFDAGPVTLLSGVQISFAESLWRIFLVCCYVAVSMVSLGAIGLFISTLTEQPIGAMIAVMILMVTSQILDSIPQLARLGPWLPTHWWMSFGDLLRAPISWDNVTNGLVSVLGYTALFGSLAWARFSSKDVSS